MPLKKTPKTSASIEEAKQRVEQNAQIQKQQEKEKAAEELRENAFTDGQLQEAWEYFKKKEAPSLGPIMATVMNTCPYQREGNLVTVYLSNSVQESQFPLKLLPALLKFLRDRLQNDLIEIKSEIRQEEGGVKRVYTDEDKLKVMEEEYPALKALREKLGLVLG